MKLSIIVPIYNEEQYIHKVLERLNDLSFSNLEKEIILINDGSTDRTANILNSLSGQYKIISHAKNLGKGLALRSGFKIATGDIIAIQDADLEYNPLDLIKLIEPILNNQTNIVYGTRMHKDNPIGHWRYYFGNRLISWLTNFLYKSKLTDVETCYKVFSGNVLNKINLSSNDFGIEIEFTTQVLKKGFSIIELPITYAPRKFSEGKKINFIDGLKALYLLVKYRFQK